MNAIDQIQRTLELPVSLQRAWLAVSTPEGLSCWFSQRVAFDGQIGAEIIFDWDNHGKKYGEVEILEPQTRFGFRWLAGEPGLVEPLTPANSTLVVFELEETSSGIRLTVTETGFSQLSEALQKPEKVKNEQGWEYELPELKNYLKG